MIPIHYLYKILLSRVQSVSRCSSTSVEQRSLSKRLHWANNSFSAHAIGNGVDT